MQKSGLREVRGLLQGLTVCKELRWDKPRICQHLSRILPAGRFPHSREAGHSSFRFLPTCGCLLGHRKTYTGWAPLHRPRPMSHRCQDSGFKVCLLHIPEPQTPEIRVFLSRTPKDQKDVSLVRHLSLLSCVRHAWSSALAVLMCTPDPKRCGLGLRGCMGRSVLAGPWQVTVPMGLPVSLKN